MWPLPTRPTTPARAGSGSGRTLAPLPGFGGDWSKVMARWDNLPLADYLAFTLAWLAEVCRIVRPTGSLWIHGTYHNIGLINFALQILEIEIINEVIWFKRNSFPNLSGRRLTASHETILWAHTGGRRREYSFHYQAAKKMACPEEFLQRAGQTDAHGLGYPQQQALQRTPLRQAPDAETAPAPQADARPFGHSGPRAAGSLRRAPLRNAWRQPRWDSTSWASRPKPNTLKSPAQPPQDWA